MVLFLAITLFFFLIGVLCLRKKFSYGIFPIAFASSVSAGIICLVVHTSMWYTNGPDTSDVVEVNDTLLNRDYDSFLKNESQIADLNDIKKVVINDTIKRPFIKYKKTMLRKDIGMLWKVGYNTRSDFVLYVNKSDYELFKAAKDSVN